MKCTCECAAQWAGSLFRELDYTKEAANGVRFRELYSRLEVAPLTSFFQRDPATIACCRPCMHAAAGPRPGAVHAPELVWQAVSRKGHLFTLSSTSVLCHVNAQSPWRT